MTAKSVHPFAVEKKGRITSDSGQSSPGIQSDGSDEAERELPSPSSQGMQYATVCTTAVGKIPPPVGSSVQYQQVDCKATKVAGVSM